MEASIRTEASRRLPADHPARMVLAGEVHARAPVALETPSRAAHLAVVVTPEQRRAEDAHLAELCRLSGALPPADGATHYDVELGPVRLKWERHTEFSTYTFFVPGRSAAPYDELPVDRLPPGWLGGLPGQTIVAAHATILPHDGAVPDAAFLAAHFGDNVVVGAEIGGGAGMAFADFMIHDDGFARFLLLDRRMTPRQAGRMVQRLFEIEAYRMMALLALPVAREQSRNLAAIERSLTALTDDLDREGADDEALLQQLTRLAAEVERGLAASQHRFGACRAYHELVAARIAELRETRIAGIQPIEEFMRRRFSPAAATCASVSQRLHAVSERVAQASALLSTRVEIAREKHNQLLLESMNRRARMQLELQQTVEALSVAAIVYYAAGLVGYGAKAAKAAGVGINPDLAAGLAIPLIAIVVIWALRRAHGKIMKA